MHDKIDFCAPIYGESHPQLPIMYIKLVYNVNTFEFKN